MLTEERFAPDHDRSAEGDPSWVRPALIALLLTTAVLYVWGLGSSGWANSYYAAAVQAATKSWKAFLFGSFDSANFITVDKAPASLWVMDISARIFGVNPWSLLVPQALMGVATVGVLYATVRRIFTPSAGLIAGAVVALTPVATLMFRFNNPDALLTLLLVGGAYALVRALESGSLRWSAAVGAFVGFAFLAKMLQAFIVVPVFAAVFLIASHEPVRRRIAHLATAGAALIVSAGWWIAIVALTPASARPYVGGSQTNSIIELTFGYNGFGRLTGNEMGSVGGGPVGTSGRWGATGLLRMFNAEVGGQIAWLIPAALIVGAAMLWLMRRAPRTDARRASVLLWSGWLVLTALVFSLAQGIFHAYYTVVLAPAIGALVGIGATELWKRRDELISRAVLASALGATAVWSFMLLGRSASFVPPLRVVILLAGLATAFVIAAPRTAVRASVLVGAGLFVAFAGPASYALHTVATPHTGAIPSAGPFVAGGGPGGPAGMRTFAAPGAGPGQQNGAAPVPPPNGRFPQGRFPPQGQLPPGGFVPPGPQNGQGFAGPGANGRGANGPGGNGPGGLGGLLDTRTPSTELVSLLRTNGDDYTWAAATIGANSGAGVQLATGLPVMAIGGFNGTDPSPTLAAFQDIVRAGKVHYFLVGGGRGGVNGPPRAANGRAGANGQPGFMGPGGPGASRTSNEISTWVQETFTPTTVGGVTVYDLSGASAGASDSV